jgi:hypothetical protein
LVRRDHRTCELALQGVDDPHDTEAVPSEDHCLGLGGHVSPDELKQRGGFDGRLIGGQGTPIG